uniref:Uncharacterized protein n=1 Tax=Noctiluca scintillans TaxID=2966 RepID=A0A7S1ARD6_NOCSC|mmetsp:Transcript_56456/g.151015  ORF Transcript_56456/g.151015 Transcript_56456/m.151015 type:complete len:113 (+) Transcript_56456:92-430(+)
MAVESVGQKKTVLDVFAKLDLPDLDAERARDILEKAGISTKDDLMRRWADQTAWDRLDLEVLLKNRLVKSFEKEMGVAYEKRRVPPKSAMVQKANQMLVVLPGSRPLKPWST